MNEQLYTYLQARQGSRQGMPQGMQQVAQQAANLRRCFPDLSERDLTLILLSPPEYAPAILQGCFGSDAAAMARAKAAWNDYVLRYIDGAPS